MRLWLNTTLALAPLTLLMVFAGRAQDTATRSSHDGDKADSIHVMAAEEHAIPLTVESAIAQLAAQNFSLRDDADHFLMRQAPDQLAVIEQALATAQDPEAIIRLTRIAMHLFLKGRTHFEGRAAILGISFPPTLTPGVVTLEKVRIGPHDEDVRMAVAVTDLQPGFPAAEVLRLGDRIVALNHEPLVLDMESSMNIDSFRRQVNTSAPGTVMQFTILRGRRLMDVAIKLAGVPDGGDQALSEFVMARQIAAQAYLRHLTPRCLSMLVIHSTVGQDAVAQDGGQ